MTDFELEVMNNLNIETVSKSIISETSKWDFKQSDYIKLINALMDLSLNKSGNELQPAKNNIPGTKLILPLYTENTIIRLFNKEKDFEIVNSWLDEEMGKWFLLSRSHSTDKSFKQLIEDDRNIFGLITLKDSTPIGLMAFLDWDKKQNKAEMRKLIGSEEYRKKGYAKEATQTWIQYGVNNLGLKKIYLHTIENNIRNVTLNKELGFQVEGILRKECNINNEYYDLLRMAYIVD
ncbi:MAG: GNAT family N-acetyltransferase [Ignavibacteriales bacterium]|nr:MAG: GNAT family N-acetyltransferase [Ignavibacteriales bacterium]